MPVSPSLNNEVALITGASGAIGSATARRFVRDGAQVVVTDVRDEGLSALADELGGLALEHDVTSDESWGAVVAAAQQRFGKLTVLVNNAGVGDPAGLENVDLEVWEQHIAVNQTGVLLGMRHAAPAIRAAGGGSIVNISSIHGLVARAFAGPGGTSIAYSATKGAVRLMSKAAAADLAPDGIRVNSVHPGYVDAPMVGRAVAPERELAKQIPMLKRFAQPEEVAAGIAFLASSDASYITAAELVIDGGYTAN
jgi:NAD(P)-dependent dehydrogenase (short-subunit alcohol dehydrogenase family)